MTTKSRSTVYSATIFFLLFTATLFYNGPGYNLYWLSVCAVLLFAWLSFFVTRLDLSRLELALGWLPVVAIAYVAWLFLNPFVSTYPYASSNAAMQLAMLPLALLGWLILPADSKQSIWRITWQFLLVCAAALAMWGIADYLLLDTRAHGPLIDANAYAALINMFLLPITFTYLRGSSSAGDKGHPRLAVCLITLLALAQCMSLSRGAAVAFLAVLPLLIWPNRARPGFGSRLAVVLLILPAAYSITKLAPLEQSRGLESLVVAPVEQLEKDVGIQARLLIWKGTWSIIKDSNLFIGTGLGTFKNYYAAHRDPTETFSSGNLAHNDYLQAQQEGGLIQLAFLLVIVVFAPMSLMLKLRPTGTGRPDDSETAIGFLVGILCVAIHGLVNFIQFVAPIALLTGFYLGHTWETLRTRREKYTFRVKATQLTPGFLKGVAIVLLAAPVLVAVLDGVIYKVFATPNPLLAQLRPHQRLVVTNAAMAIRPANPIPRVSYINDHLKYAEEFGVSASLDEAEREAKILTVIAPALASGRFFLGKARALRGGPNDLKLAREDLERAVKLLPAATGIRLELVKLYQRLGHEDKAYQSTVEAKKWVLQEVDLPALATFAQAAEILNMNRKNKNEAEYWAWVHARLTALGLAG